MKFIRKNKYTIIAIIILMLLVVVSFYVKNIFVPDEGKASYGNRLDGISEHKLSDELFTKISDKLKEDEKVVEVNNKVHGKIINLIITVNNDVSIDDAKNIANSTISMFEDNELSFYSLQVYLKKEDKSLNNFPIIGYKGTEASGLVFTKDRDITQTGDSNEE